MIKRPKECEYLKSCDFRTTKDYYGKICVGNYEACRIYGRNKKQLKKPFEWVQHIAVEQSEIVIHG